MRVILASASPRRRELLEQIGLDFAVRVSRVAEKAGTDVPELLVQELSAQKAGAVLGETAQEDAAEGLLIIGADTVVVYGDSILGKPKNAGEAAQMLKRLQGHTHEVYTGVTLICVGRDAHRDGRLQKSFHERTKVHFHPMSDAEIAAYVATGEPLDKAGAYGIQGMFARYLKGIEGDYNNVVGLPVGRLYQELKAWGMAEELLLKSR